MPASVPARNNRPNFSSRPPPIQILRVSRFSDFPTSRFSAFPNFQRFSIARPQGFPYCKDPMDLTTEQKQTVSKWVAAGDNLSAIQSKLNEQFKISMTYMDVRFLVDDLNLELKDPKPKADASDVSKTPPAAPAKASGEKKGFLDKMKEKVGLGSSENTEEIAEELDEEEDLPIEDALPAGASSVTVEVDKITLIPGALASGSVTFSDGVTGKWIVDQYGRPGFTEISQPGYRPKPADAQAFMQELGLMLQKHRGY